MSYTLFYFDESKLDVRKAKSWYKKQQDCLEKRFAEAVKETILTLQKNPLAYETRYLNTRIVFTKTFPFGIHFYINHKQIIIVAIIHCKRNINKIKDRLQ